MSSGCTVQGVGEVPALWDLGFLAFGALLLLVGSTLAGGATRPAKAPLPSEE
jgi:hypothetical protein